jgi:hypothetical protein
LHSADADEIRTQLWNELAEIGLLIVKKPPYLRQKVAANSTSCDIHNHQLGIPSILP